MEDLKDFHVVTVYKRGKRVYHDGIVEDFPLPEIPEHLNKRAHDTFHLPVLSPADFANTRLRGVIGMVPGRSSPRTRATPPVWTYPRTF